ncbi:MAG: hypothetical protein JSW67_05235 [Candidatus Latescibacterota bacterium]|nr:MAG: hypothetical protein JSW67_05235 [Candidatus Latescibacterota bacterium]
MHARFRRALAAFFVAALCLPSTVGSDTLRSARGCLEVALQAADAWADDAQLVWLENDAPVDAEGRADAWGFLFFSPQQGAMRSYSVREGVLALADDHAVTAPAPALETWVDSGDIAQRAWKRANEKCESGCALATLLLVRGVFAHETTWVAVFQSTSGPRLFVVMDAANGKIIRDWRG